MKKIKVLCSGETSGAATGYGTYNNNVLSRIVENDKLHIAEFAVFGSINDNKFKDAKWRYYPNGVDENHPEHKDYHSNPENKKGAWRFEKTILDFKPDIVWDIRDPYVFRHVCKSPLRDFYHLSLMPTVDSFPQQFEWIEMISGADSVFTYSDWAIPVLKEQSGDKINPICSAFPGVEFDKFYPSKNKNLDKKKYGLPEDSFIIGTVMRNQKRKMFEDLFHAFEIYLDRYSETEEAKKTYLLIHTSHPDYSGWNLQKLIVDHGISNKVFFSYVCKKTGRFSMRKFSGINSYTKETDALTAVMPSTTQGASREQLGDFYRCLDLYTQYAIAEGFGCPMAEAAGSGVTVAAVDYSAMSDVVEKTKGIPLEPQKMFYEFETNSYRAMPNNDKTADAWYKFFKLTKEQRQSMSEDALKAAKKYFNWDRTAKIWSDHFESIVLKDKQGQWDAPKINYMRIPKYEEKKNLTNTEYVKWLCDFVAQDSTIFYSFLGMNSIEQLNNRFSCTFKNGVPVGRQQIYNVFANIGNNKISCEALRHDTDQLKNLDFIQFAHAFERGLNKCN